MTPEAEIAAKRPVVAVVDDDMAVCSSLKFSLELEGFAVRIFYSSAELLDVLHNSVFLVAAIARRVGGSVAV